jgi:type IV secretory pathway VirB2 component (pilin)
MSSRWFQVCLIRPIRPLLRSKWARPTAAIPVLLFLMPVAALAQGGSPFDTGFTAIQSLFTGTIAKVASLVAIVIGGYGFAGYYDLRGFCYTCLGAGRDDERARPRPQSSSNQTCNAAPGSGALCP